MVFSPSFGDFYDPTPTLPAHGEGGIVPPSEEYEHVARSYP